MIRLQNKDKIVAEVFNVVAKRYDLMNDLMSFGLHRLWKRKMKRLVNPVSGERILDVAGGTGDIAFLLSDKEKKGQGKDIIVCDINPNMLGVGKERAEKRGISGLEWVEGNAEKLPFEEKSFDKYTIAFGIRNVSDVNAALRDAHRVLKDSGQFYCMEFHSLKDDSLFAKLFKPLYKFYLFKIIPFIGKIVVGDAAPYEYLADSIWKFPTENDFCNMMEQAGFSDVKSTPIMFGVVNICYGIST